jgi:repressor LexA
MTRLLKAKNPSPLTPSPLTPKELAVLNFLSEFKKKSGFSPSFDEIRIKFKLAAISSVQQYITQLESKGYIRSPGTNQKRAIEIIEEVSGPSTKLPLLGSVAAGRPIENTFHDRYVDIPKDMLKGRGEYFALLVKGDSMIDEGILDGDFVIVKKQANAENGQKIVASIDNEATIKKYFKRKDKIELHPANQNYKPIYVDATENFKIEGIFAGLIRIE